MSEASGRETKTFKFYRECIRKNLCRNIPCTTCGAIEYRRGLKEIGPQRIISDLGEITDFDMRFHMTERFIDDMTLWLYSIGVLTHPGDLSDISGSPALEHFEDFYRSYHERRKEAIENAAREADKVREFRRIKAEKATHSLINAIRRKDYKAIQALLDKGADPERYQDFWSTSAIDELRKSRGFAFEFQDNRWVLALRKE